MSPPAQNEDWTDSWDTPEPVAAKPKASPSIPLTAAVSKEDKAAEMARRKEERRLVRFAFEKPLISLTYHPAYCYVEGAEEAGCEALAHGRRGLPSMYRYCLFMSHFGTKILSRERRISHDV